MTQQTRAIQHEQEYVTKVGDNVNEACTLIEDGIKYYTGENADDGKIFAKPKRPFGFRSVKVDFRIPSSLNMVVLGVGFEPSSY